MANKLPRLSKSILDKPQLITASKFQEISEVLENREYLKSFEPEAFLDIDDLVDDASENLVDESVGILRVEGPTTYKLTGFEALCGGCSYTGLLSQMKEFVEQGKTTVLMKIDSCGGQAYRMMYTSRELRRLADENDIKLIGYCDGTMASAGMGIGSACHELIANPESEVGSIGVVISLLDQSKALEKEGLKRVFITAGGEKVPFNEDGTFRDTFLADLQESVTDLYKKFTTHVADMRNINVQTVRDTEARMFKASDSLQLGLIDKVMEENEFYEYLGTFSAPSKVETPLTEKPKQTPIEASKVSTTTLTPKKENLMSENIDMEAFEAMKAKLDAFEAKEIQTSLDTKKANLSASLSGATFLSDVEGVVSFLMNADEVQASMLTTVLSDAGKQLTEMSSAHQKEVTTLTAEHDVTVLALKGQVVSAELAKETIKEEFAAPASIRGEVEEPASREDAIAAQIAKDKKHL